MIRPLAALRRFQTKNQENSPFHRTLLIRSIACVKLFYLMKTLNPQAFLLSLFCFSCVCVFLDLLLSFFYFCSSCDVCANRNNNKTSGVCVITNIEGSSPNAIIRGSARQQMEPIVRDDALPSHALEITLANGRVPATDYKQGLLSRRKYSLERNIDVGETWIRSRVNN